MEYGYSTMGYEIAGGLGVAMAEPTRRVFVMVGDGSYLMLANEILTACQERVSMTIVLLDNHGYRCIRNLSAACGADNPFNDFRYPRPGQRHLHAARSCPSTSPPMPPAWVPAS